MIDLVCRRYPGRRPSDYLELDDYEGLQLDIALALKFSQKESEEDLDKISAIQDMIKPLGQALGVKYEKKKAPADMTPVSNEIPVEVALALFGGKGIEVIDGTK